MERHEQLMSFHTSLRKVTPDKKRTRDSQWNGCRSNDVCQFITLHMNDVSNFSERYKILYINSSTLSFRIRHKLSVELMCKTYTNNNTNDNALPIEPRFLYTYMHIFWLRVMKLMEGNTPFKVRIFISLLHPHVQWCVLYMLQYTAENTPVHW